MSPETLELWTARAAIVVTALGMAWLVHVAIAVA